MDLVAFGGIVWRTGPGSGQTEIAIVHRPTYGDWSLPKGKPEAGETGVESALREVEEETGLACRAGEELAVTRYMDADGRRKEVHYFVMTAVSAARRDPDNEIDVTRWATINELPGLLSYDVDQQLVAELPALLGTFVTR